MIPIEAKEAPNMNRHTIAGMRSPRLTVVFLLSNTLNL
jgi:hypothetical protein